MRSVRFFLDGRICEGSLKNGQIFPFDKNNASLAFEEAELAPPAAPTKIVCLGLNYRQHALELGLHIPAVPVIFIKPSSSVIGHRQDICIPDGAGRVDHEAELAFVIGRTACKVKARDAAAYIKGYTCLNDVTARDLQEVDGQWTRAKSFDTFAPVGPYLQTDFDPARRRIRCLRNGMVVQEACTSEMIFTVPAILEFVSNVMTLYPEDIVSTGTPSGIGPIAKGDTVEVQIEGIGTLRNGVR